MRPELQEWVKDLRSGAFPQGVGRLRSEAGYCCLGVACETYRRVTGKGEWKTYDNVPSSMNMYFNAGESSAGDVLPQEVREWLGFKQANPMFDVHGELTRASMMNDSLQMTFAEIADVIEASQKGALK